MKSLLVILMQTTGIGKRSSLSKQRYMVNCLFLFLSSLFQMQMYYRDAADKVSDMPIPPSDITSDEDVLDEYDRHRNQLLKQTYQQEG
jgi:hypothetical protein